MIRTAQAVIGAGWGDEGKGLMTDHLCHAARRAGASVTVIRSNGGAQAGHTVVTPDGRRHVFHHIGSGSFAGADTHLSRFFVAHPMLLRSEIDALRGQRVDLAAAGAPTLTIDPDAPVTTPWDTMINQILEMARNQGRHGSCGLGFGETIEREENGVQLLARHLRQGDLRSRLEYIRDVWMPRRMGQLGVDFPDRDLADAAQSTGLMQAFLRDCDLFTDAVGLRSDADVAGLPRGATVIFEAAQGLQLDMAFGAFPFVTRSHTGLRNIARLCADMGIDALQAHYVTRAYATRHGAGPLPYEAQIDGWATVTDPTNAPNEWQGRLRFAPLQPAAMGALIRQDLAQAGGLHVQAGLAVTCMDQIGASGVVMDDGKAADIPKAGLAVAIAERVGLPLSHISSGPSRDHVASQPR